MSNYEQMTMFDFATNKYKITKPIRLIELFAGVGAQAMSLRDLGANFSHWKVVEFDKYAVASYNAIHGTDFPVLDIRDIHAEDLEIIERDKYEYILTYSFPCTDISVAGKMEGYSEDSDTRSSLLWEVRRILQECGDNLPQILLMENVSAVHSAGENLQNFQKWISFLDGLGYSSFWRDMNAKDYGIPQSRDRTFMLSILGDWSYKFPNPRKLEKVMKDYLEDSVDEKFYLKTEKAKELIDKLIDGGSVNPIERDTKCLGGINGDAEWQTQPRQQNRVYSMGDTALAQTAQLPNGSYNYLDVQENVTVKLHNCATTNPKFVPSMETTDTAATLMARDYKGLGNYEANGVIVVNPMDDGTARTIKAQYQNTSTANLDKSSTFGATGVMSIWELESDISET